MKPVILNNFLDKTTVSDLYYYLIRQNTWCLDRASKSSEFLVDTFPGMTIYDAQNPENIVVNNVYLFGYFSGLLNAIRERYKDETGITIPTNIKRMHLGAKNNNAVTEFHPDSPEPTDYTILGFIMPNWSQEWGGDIKIEDESYTCEPGNFIIFPSTLYHNGVSPVEKTPYWRISLNIICGRR